jgi:hypothetical protein
VSQLIDRVNISDDRTLPHSMPNPLRWRHEPTSVASRPIRSFLQERSLATCTFSSTTNLIMRDKVPMLSPFPSRRAASRRGRELEPNLNLGRFALGVPKAGG